MMASAANGGGTNITREPRNGRTFEYQGEDPILAGTLVGNRIKCEQAQHVLGDIKHYAANDQESGRNEVNVIISKPSVKWRRDRILNAERISRISRTASPR